MSSLLRVNDLHKSFVLGPKTLNILKGINLEVAEGEMVAIVGQSGSGKTTLLHLLGTLDRPDKGEIFYNEDNITSFSNDGLEKFRNNHIGFVFQFFQLLPEFTALENTLMPALIGGVNHSKARKLAQDVLEEVGLSERINHFPSQMSGGEQQRAAIARALVQNPRVLLADEPTGNLDTITGKKVFEMLKNLQRKKGLTSIIVTHNEEISAQCDRVITLESINGVAAASSAADQEQ